MKVLVALTAHALVLVALRVLADVTLEIGVGRYLLLDSGCTYGFL